MGARFPLFCCMDPREAPPARSLLLRFDMKVLLADDDPLCRDVVTTMLRKNHYEVITASSGANALALLSEPNAPQLVIADWEMPRLDGLSLCRWIRHQHGRAYTYVILLTGRSEREDQIAGLRAGADDFVTKPIHETELLARIQVGERIIQLENSLTQKVIELQNALLQVQQLQGLITVCMHCHRVHAGTNTWQAFEKYIEAHSQAVFSHGLCERCLDTHYPT